MKTNVFRTYTIGFVLSLILTLAAFGAVWLHASGQALPSRSVLAAILVGLAAVQLYVQLIFFLHMGRESSPRWNWSAFAFMLLVLLIVVGGSLWIMKNLDYHMTPSDATNYIFKDEGISR